MPFLRSATYMESNVFVTMLGNLQPLKRIPQQALHLYLKQNITTPLHLVHLISYDSKLKQQQGKKIRLCITSVLKRDSNREYT